MAERARYDLEIYKGATYQKTATWTIDDEPVDFTDCVIKSQIRMSENGTLVTEFDCDSIPTEGIIMLGLSAEKTAQLTPGIYYWDLKIVDADEIVRYDLYGKVSVTGRVTD